MMRACLSLLIVILLASGCAASFSYTPLSSEPRELYFTNVRSSREFDRLIVEGEVRNNLGFEVKDLMLVGTAFNALGEPATRITSDLYGKLEQSRAQEFKMVFQDQSHAIRTFQFLANSYVPSAQAESAPPAGFSKTVGFGTDAMRTAESISQASGDNVGSALSLTTQALSLSKSAVSFAGSPPSWSSSSEPRLIQAQSSLYTAPQSPRDNTGVRKLE